MFQLVIGPEDCAPRTLEEVVLEAVENGVTLVQLREKKASDDEVVAMGCRLQAILKPRGIPLLVNDRVDVARRLDADGVHLGQSDMPYSEARALLGPDKMIGLTVETLVHCRTANELEGLAYIGVGPIFATQTKLDAPPPLGLEGLQAIAALSRYPVVAIGGVNLANTPGILEAGAQGIAVVSALCKAFDLATAAVFFAGLLGLNQPASSESKPFGLSWS